MQVHEDVDKRVQQGREVEIAPNIEDEAGSDQGDGRVVVEVQEGDLAERLAQNEDPGVEKLPELLQEEHVDKPAHTATELGFIVAIVAGKATITGQKKSGETKKRSITWNKKV